MEPRSNRESGKDVIFQQHLCDLRLAVGVNILGTFKNTPWTTDGCNVGKNRMLQGPQNIAVKKWATCIQQYSCDVRSAVPGRTRTEFNNIPSIACHSDQDGDHSAIPLRCQTGCCSNDRDYSLRLLWPLWHQGPQLGSQFGLWKIGTIQQHL